jgi:hypothetical protein
MTLKNKKDCELSGTNIPDVIGHACTITLQILTNDQVQTMSDNSNRLDNRPAYIILAITRVEVAVINSHPFIYRAQTELVWLLLSVLQGVHKDGATSVIADAQAPSSKDSLASSAPAGTDCPECAAWVEHGYWHVTAGELTIQGACGLNQPRMSPCSTKFTSEFTRFVVGNSVVRSSW